MATKKSTTSVASTRVRYIDGPQYTSTYANNIAFAVNAVDLVLIFGELIDVVDGEAIVERRARVTLAPPQVKILQLIIAEQIRQYEENSGGPIVIPKPLQSVQIAKSKEG